MSSEDKYVVTFAPPAIPLPPRDYSYEYHTHFNNVLRIYFNQLDAFARGITSDLAVFVETPTVNTTLAAKPSTLVVCGNIVPITISLPATPANYDVVRLKRASTSVANVTIAGNGNTIDGASSLIVGGVYNAPYLIYTTAAGEWSLI